MVKAGERIGHLEVIPECAFKGGKILRHQLWSVLGYVHSMLRMNKFLGRPVFERWLLFFSLLPSQLCPIFTEICIGSCASGRMGQITARFIGHSWTEGLQYGSSILLLLENAWSLWVAASILRNLWTLAVGTKNSSLCVKWNFIFFFTTVYSVCPFWI